MLTTNKAGYDRKFRLLRQHGMSVTDLERHAAKKVIFERYQVTGYNYRMTDIQAAVGIEQLKKMDRMIEDRERIDGLYRKHLSGISWLGLPYRPDYARANWQSYPVRVLKGSPGSRDRLMQSLFEGGIATKPGIMNAHAERPYPARVFDLEESERARKEVMLLPVYHGLAEADIKFIAKMLVKVGTAGKS